MGYIKYFLIVGAFCTFIISGADSSETIIELSPTTGMLLRGSLQQKSLEKPLSISLNATPFLYNVQLVKRFISRPRIQGVDVMHPNAFLEKYANFSSEELASECCLANPTLTKGSFNYEVLLRCLKIDFVKLGKEIGADEPLTRER